jgi:formylglycine-generating enzyme required for sulfatase activity
VNAGLGAGLVVVASLATGCRARGAEPRADPTPPARPATPAAVPAPPAATADAPVAVALAARPAPCPPEMALVEGSFCVDRWEAALLDEDGTPRSPYHPVGAARVRAVSQAGLVPQAHVSLQQADAACRRSSKRLCTTEQWVNACMGTRPRRRFGYGPSERPGVCNVGRRGHPILLLHEGRRKTDSWSLNDARLNQIGSTLAPAGAFEECRTPQGVYDLVGNLLEWTRGPPLKDGERPLLMGGHYLDGAENGAGCAYVTMRHGAEYHDFTTGFRCCKPADRDALAALASPGDLVPAATQAAGAPRAGAPVPRDPPGFRSFEHPMGKLPAVPPPPPYQPPGAACPVDMVLVDGKRCGLVVQECLRWIDPPGMPQRACGEFARPTPCRGAERPMRFCIDRYEYQPASYRLPLVHVAWSEAQAICRALDKRLCHEEEWEFACEGEQASPYPYGWVRDGSACNNDREELFTLRGKLIDRRVAADALPRCKSPFGVFNLVGNVDEWTARSSAEPGRRSILRGGWWLTGRSRCRAATDAHGESYAGPQTGFRCCKAAR